MELIITSISDGSRFTVKPCASSMTPSWMALKIVSKSPSSASRSR